MATGTKQATLGARMRARTPGSSLLQKVFGTLGASISAAVLTFALQVLAARVLSPDAFGKFVFGTTLLGIAGLTAPLGFQSVFLRFLTQAKVSSRFGVYKELVRRGTRFALIGSLVAASACIVVWMSTPQGKGGLLTLSLILLAIPFAAVSKLWVAQLRIWGHAAQAVYLEVPLREGSAALYALTAIAFGLQFAAPGFTALYVCGVLTSYFALRVFGSRSAIVPSNEQATAVESKAWWSLAAAAFAAIAANQLLRRVDVLIVGSVVGLADSGAYSAASRIADVLQLPLVAANVVVAPKIAELYALGKMNELKILAQQVTAIAFGLCCVMALPLLIFPESVLVIFGKRFTDVGTVLRLLALGQLVNAATGCAGLLLTMTGAEWRAAAITLSTGVMAVLANYILAHELGLLGVGVGAAVSIAVWNVWLCVAAYRHTGVLAVPALTRVRE